MALKKDNLSANIHTYHCKKNSQKKSNLRCKIIMLQLYFLNLKNIFTPFKFAKASLNLEKPTLN
jgi:hypothetical protein